MSLSKVLDVARGEVGVTESPPGSNRVKYWEVMPSWNGQPWCVVFLMWCFRKAGDAMAFFGGAFTASCSTLLAWYKNQGQTVPVEDVQAGDIVLLNFHGGKDPEHCGLVEFTPVKGSMTIATIEGNTTNGGGSQSDGGQVCRKTRYMTQVVAVCRPIYTEDEMKKDYEGHWAEQSIRRVMGNGFMKGYPDGSFRPDQPVTRAELAVILDRLELEGRLKIQTDDCK
jgi:hypothetical protein